MGISQTQLTARLASKFVARVENFKDGSFTTFKVEWPDSCTYRLTPGRTDTNTEIILQPAVVRILEVRDSSYLVEGWMEGYRNRYRSELIRITKADFQNKRFKKRKKNEASSIAVNRNEDASPQGM
jgi:hypothetical protein